MGFTRLVRVSSEKQLKIAAEREVARRYGRQAPSPHGLSALFWQRVYVPIYHKLPWELRSRIMIRMPGSHRRTWHKSDQLRGPAV